MTKRKGIVQETMIFGVLMAASALFIMILAADAPSELQNIFTLLKKFSYAGGAALPAVGAYFFWQMWSN